MTEPKSLIEIQQEELLHKLDTFQLNIANANALIDQLQNIFGELQELNNKAMELAEKL